MYLTHWEHIGHNIIMDDFTNGVSYIADSYMGAFSHWFVVSYLGLCLLSPILNAWLEKADDSLLLKYIAIFYIFSTLFGYIFYAKFHRPVDFNEGMSILSFVGLCLVGALIRRNSFSWLRKDKMVYICSLSRFHTAQVCHSLPVIYICRAHRLVMYT